MSFKVLPMLAGMLMLSLALEAVDSNENLSRVPQMKDSENPSNENLNRLKEAHDSGEIFGGYEAESSSYQSLN